MRVLAVVGAVSALSATSFGQTLNKGNSKSQPAAKAAPKAAPVPTKTTKPAPRVKPTDGKATAATGAVVKGGMPAFLTNDSPKMVVVPNHPARPVGRGASNDSCATPQIVSGSPVTLNADFTLNTTGTEHQGEALCLAFGTSAIHNDEWFQWTATGTGTATATACGGSTVDTRIAAYAGPGCPAEGTALACNDDFCGVQSQITFNVTQGQTYILQIGRYSEGALGTAAVTLTGPGGGGGGPSNDNCGSATGVGEGTYPFDLTTATNDGTATCGASATSADVWYAYTPTQTGNCRVETCNQTTMDSVLAAFDTCAGNQLACNDDNCGLQSGINFPVTQGVTVLVRVAGFNGARGAGNVVISVAPPAGNDSCSTPIAITGNGPFNFDNSAATTDGVGDPLCLAFGLDNMDHDVWFDWTANCNPGELASVEFCGGTTVDTKVAVYDGAGCPVGAALACNDDSCGLQSVARWTPTPGAHYTIRVGTFPGGAGGTGTFVVNCFTPPTPVCNLSAQQCQDTSAAIAYNVTFFTWADSVASDGAAITDICTSGIYFNAAQVPDNWTVTVWDSNANGFPNQMIGQFSQAGGSLTVTSVQTLDVFVGRPVFQFHMTFNTPIPTTAGGCYWFQLDNAIQPEAFFVMDGDGSNGNFQSLQAPTGGSFSECNVVPDDMQLCVNVGALQPGACTVTQCGTTPANDFCANASTALSFSGATDSGGTCCASADGVLTCSGDAEAPSVWYSIVGNGHTLTVDACGSGYDTRLEVFSGDCNNLVCEAFNDDSCGLQSSVTFCTQVGTNYLIMLHGFGGGSGAFVVTRTDGDACVPCLGIDCPANSVAEGEDCGADANGGCNATPITFRSLTCNEQVAGTVWADANNRDTDWYQFTVPASGNVSATFTADLPIVCFVLVFTNDDCAQGINLVSQSFADACGTGSIAASGLTPGSHAYFFFATGNADGSGIFAGFPCGRANGNDYCAAFDIGQTCTAPCPCDFNSSGSLNSQDFFDFLSCFFGGNCPPGRTADYNGNGTVNSQDFFDFLACFFGPPAGCN